MNCKICGYEIPDDNITCPKCGAPVVNEESAQIDESELEEIAVNSELETTDISEEQDNQAEETDTENTYEPEEDGDNNGELSEEENPYDEENGEFDENYAISEQDLTQTNKMPAGFKIAACIIAIILVATAGAAGYFQYFVPGKANPILGIFGIKTNIAPAQPLIYTKQEDSKSNIYIKSEGTQEFLLKSAESTKSTFTLNSDFVIGGKNLFYLDDKTLYAYTTGEAASKKITDNVLPGSLVISADHSSILFIQKVGDNSSMDLYKFKKGSKDIERVETLPLIKNNEQKPVYGFIDKTNDVWYLMIVDNKSDSQNNSNGELFVKIANKASKSIANDVNDVIFGSDKGNTLVYTSLQDSKTVLYLKEKGKEAVVLSENNKNSKPVIVNSPAKGVFYLGDVTEDSASGQAGNIKGTLYYQKFRGDKVQIDTEVSVALKLALMNSQVDASYDYSADSNSDDSIIYMKNQEILISKNGKAGSVPEGFDYSKSTPSFSKDGNIVAFTSDKALKYSKYVNGAWTSPETIAENASQFSLSKDGSNVAYLVADESDQTKAVLNVYSSKNKQTNQVSDTAIGQCYFNESGNIVFYASNYNQQNGSAAMSYYTIGKQSSVLDNEVNGFIVSETYVPYAVKSSQGSNSADIYTVTKDMKFQLISQNIQNLNHY